MGLNASMDINEIIQLMPCTSRSVVHRMSNILSKNFAKFALGSPPSVLLCKFVTLCKFFKKYLTRSCLLVSLFENFVHIR